MSLAATRMDLAIIILSEISNTETRQILYDSTLYEESKKKIMQIKLFAKQTQPPTLRKQICGCQAWETWEREIN